MKRLEMNITHCGECPYYKIESIVGEGELYWCRKLHRYLDIVPKQLPNDCPLPNCEPSGNTG